MLPSYQIEPSRSAIDIAFTPRRISAPHFSLSAQAAEAAFLPFRGNDVTIRFARGGRVSISTHIMVLGLFRSLEAAVVSPTDTADQRLNKTLLVFACALMG